MEGKQPASVYLKRRMLARDYLAQIPEEVINLDDWVQARANFGMGQAREIYDAHMQANGLDALKCGSVACLAGWLWTMPEYKEWAKGHIKRSIFTQIGVGDNVDALRTWLGLDPADEEEHLLFQPARDCGYDLPMPFTASDKDLALNRLDQLIKRATPGY